MKKENKMKLMVIVGAGASIELGMPSVNEIDELFSKWAKKYYPLANNRNESLYSYIRDEVNNNYKLNPKLNFQKTTNFEELLYVMLQLASIIDNNYNIPLNSFFNLKELPIICSFNKSEKKVEGNDLRHLCSLLIDNLLKEFRERCKSVQKEYSANFTPFKNFIEQLNTNFDVAFITLNYDNLISQACPSLFTGFNQQTGSFDPSSVYGRNKWELIYHLHGCVHFDMQGEDLDMHAIKWNSNLNSNFKNNSSGRNSQDSSEGIEFPTSVIVAGYGKTNQIQRVPFRTYYSKVDEIAHKADAILFMGYGFNDFHLNNSLHSIRNKNRPVVVLDWASDKQDSLQFRHDDWSRNLLSTIPVNAYEMSTEEYKHIAANPSELKINNKFEVCRNKDYPLSVWYSGFIEACRNYEKIIAELSS